MDKSGGTLSKRFFSSLGDRSIGFRTGLDFKGLAPDDLKTFRKMSSEEKAKSLNPRLHKYYSH